MVTIHFFEDIDDEEAIRFNSEIADIIVRRKYNTSKECRTVITISESDYPDNAEETARLIASGAYIITVPTPEDIDPHEYGSQYMPSNAPDSENLM